MKRSVRLRAAGWRTWRVWRLPLFSSRPRRPRSSSGNTCPLKVSMWFLVLFVCRKAGVSRHVSPCRHWKTAVDISFFIHRWASVHGIARSGFRCLPSKLCSQVATGYPADPHRPPELDPARDLYSFFLRSKEGLTLVTVFNARNQPSGATYNMSVPDAVWMPCLAPHAPAHP